MKNRVFLALGAFLGLLLPAQGQDVGYLTLKQTIPLAQIQGGFNHMSVDSGRSLLFATAPANNSLEIIDLKAGKSVRSIGGETPAAVRFAPEFNQLYVTRGESVYIYDGKSFDVVTKVDLQCRLDELQYDPASKQLFVGCMTDGKTAIKVISIPDGKPLGEIKLPARPQGFVLELKGKRIFANMASLNKVAVIDREKRTLSTTWTVKEAGGNYPIALDEFRHRLFVGCRTPARVVVFDSNTGKPLASVGIAGGADDMFYDSVLQLVYVSCGEGSLDIVTQGNGDAYKFNSRLETASGARNSAFSSELSSIFVAVPQRGKEPAEIRVFLIDDVVTRLHSGEWQAF
jgi:DNA-binding beta-propeller fold protein YncE